MTPSTVSPFSLPNVRRFIAFRVLFNARFYYPVFTILFLDFGLTLEQFVLLNTVWAFTIVMAEVPSGALADIIGRKYLLVTTSILMILEMLLLSFVPLGNSRIIFSAFLFNRILSGLAEALASGADEALAYDTLVAEGNPEDWPKVLDIQMRVQHIGYIFSMMIGAVVYDPGAVNRVLRWLNISGEVTQDMSMRYPIYLTLVLGICAFVAVTGMREPKRDGQQEYGTSLGKALWEASRLTWRAASWIWRTPFAMAIILFGMTFDHILRMLVTMTSEYYRLINLPEASFGLIGAAVALLGLVVPRIARMMTEHLSAGRNVFLLALFSLLALSALTLFIPYGGLVPMMFVFVGLMLTSFFTSHYLNKITASRQRATVLSFKGLAFNAAYGMIGIFYAGLIRHVRHHEQGVHPTWSTAQVENEAFRQSISWFPWYLLCAFAVVTAICLLRLRRSGADSATLFNGVSRRKEDENG